MRSVHNVEVIWRGNKITVEIDPDATLKELGQELQRLTNVKADTMRLIVPQLPNKTSRLLSPFSDEHERLSLQETSILEGKSIRMMGAFENEVNEVLQNAKANLRIAGFDEEEKRLRQRMSDRPHTSLKLPQGPYIFSDFRTLQLPGIELNPPASEALKIMHMLAADPGIVAIMNKHCWHVGIMTEMAPVGYVGISPKCLLGFNKNKGEEISLRLRTDDLKGFRKYASIKKTLLHELAHMIYSEHDATFYAFDKQLNQEAESLDWTRSRGHTLSGARYTEHYENSYVGERGNSSHKLGGNKPDQLASARASSVAAAYHRLATASDDSISEVHEQSHLDGFAFHVHEKDKHKNFSGKRDLEIESSYKVQGQNDLEPDPDDCFGNENKFEPSLDDSQGTDESCSKSTGSRKNVEPDPDNLESCLKCDIIAEPEPLHPQEMEILESRFQPRNNVDEPDPDDCDVKRDDLGSNSNGNITRPGKDESLVTETTKYEANLRKAYEEPDPDASMSNGIIQPVSRSNDNLVLPNEISSMQIDEPDPDDQEIQIIQDPVSVACKRMQKTIEMLQAEVNPTQATTVLQTLFKIIRNVLEHPGESKYRRLRKANPMIQKNVTNYKAAMEFLFLIGFNENVVDEIGRPETYLVLTRDDPALLWLAKSSLETCITV
ncbi:putative WLM domain, PUB domain-containing protein [Rosa chinensis]|uniref:Putative WLM domain, PUB domain-containing protein n=1 Tax=Rosa chinensis TaxID=74649 RepID=A0A2P6S1R5_ROSCH|nr:uncharacterized protein LOC112187008 isoform X1 [Rosa chinensis]PRQ52634.1 putative WLM domain, PUB domain-containing protein [Rosa chinensis]